MIYKKFTQISIYLNWTFGGRSLFNLEASWTTFSRFLWLEISYLSETLCETKNVERVLNEEIVSEMWKKVKNKKLWKEEQMAKVQISINQVNNYTSTWQKIIMAWIFNLFDKKWKAFMSCRYIYYILFFFAKKVTQRAMQTHNFL